jgi:hypothetical protein
MNFLSTQEFKLAPNRQAFAPHGLFPALLPAQFSVPCSLFPIPYSLFPVLCSIHIFSRCRKPPVPTNIREKSMKL